MEQEPRFVRTLQSASRHFMSQFHSQARPVPIAMTKRNRMSERRMSDVKKQGRTDVEAVGRQFSAKWEKGSDPSNAYITVARKRVAVDVITLKRRGSTQGNAAKPRLRFDKVATRLIERLQATLGETVPVGMTVLLTITAPIRLPSKTAAVLEGKIQTLFLGGDRRVEIRKTRFTGIMSRFDY